MFNWIKRLFCSHENTEYIYCDIDGWGELHYCLICKDCGKEWSK